MYMSSSSFNIHSILTGVSDLMGKMLFGSLQESMQSLTNASIILPPLYFNLSLLGTIYTARQPISTPYAPRLRSLISGKRIKLLR